MTGPHSPPLPPAPKPPDRAYPVVIFAQNLRSAQFVADAFQMRPGGWRPWSPTVLLGRSHGILIVEANASRTMPIEEHNACTEAERKDFQIIRFSSDRYYRVTRG